MRAIIGRLSLLIVLAASVAFFGARPGALAQDATPEADAAMEGVTFEPLGMADGVELPSPASLIAVKVTIEPGAGEVFAEDDPSSGLLLVESGAVTVVVGAEWSVTRGGGEFGELEVIASEVETTLETGDAAYIPGSVTGEIRNDGTEPAVGTIFLVVPGSMSDMDGEATPAP